MLQSRAAQRPPALLKMILASVVALQPTRPLDTERRQTLCICDERTARSLCQLKIAVLLVQPVFYESIRRQTRARHKGEKCSMQSVAVSRTYRLGNASVAAAATPAAAALFCAL